MRAGQLVHHFPGKNTAIAHHIWWTSTERHSEFHDTQVAKKSSRNELVHLVNLRHNNTRLNTASKVFICISVQTSLKPASIMF